MRNSLWLIPAILSLFTVAASACPIGSIELASAEGKFCVEVEARPAIRNYKAAPICESIGGRLCSAEELRVACESRELNGAGLAWEWSVSMDKYTSASLNGSCDALAFGELTDHAALRCCK
ncbi:MAG: hypothetical protein EOP11_22390 [Proteobacteria bacterium]|nr:MAG: hypothetical protein EOP11_22390 [Pseudomonadota bacterium]